MSIRSWFRGSALVCAFAPPAEPAYASWALKNAKLTTPDEIITAAIVKSIASAYDDWRLHSLSATASNYEEISNFRKKFGLQSRHNRLLVNEKKNVTVSWFFNTYYEDESLGEDFIVNKVTFPKEHGREILSAYYKIRDERARLAAAARKAAAELERNEKAWDLAEHLLGMKRNEHGALVPVKTV